MDPAAWRKQEKLTVRAAAKRLGISSPMSVLRYERGEREAPNSAVLAYQRESKDKSGVSQVTGADLDRVRKRYLRAQTSTTKAAA